MSVLKWRLSPVAARREPEKKNSDFPHTGPLSKLKPERVALVATLYFIQAKPAIGETCPR